MPGFWTKTGDLDSDRPKAQQLDEVCNIAAGVLQSRGPKGMACPPRFGPVVTLHLDEVPSTAVAKKKSFSSGKLLQKDFF
jgi:hypothetical protein